MVTWRRLFLALAFGALADCGGVVPLPSDDGGLVADAFGADDAPADVATDASSSDSGAVDASADGSDAGPLTCVMTDPDSGTTLALTCGDWSSWYDGATYTTPCTAGYCEGALCGTAYPLGPIGACVP